MKLNIKGLAFMGFAAAVFASAANAAFVPGSTTANESQKNIVTSKYYVDNGLDAKQNVQIAEVADAGKAVVVDSAGKINISDATLKTVATSGSYNDLSDKPSIPTATSDLNNDSGFITSADVPAQAQADWAQTTTTAADYIKNKPTLPTAAASGTHISTSTDANNVITVNVSDITDAGTGVDSTDTGLTTGKAVYEYVASNPGNYITASDVPAQVNADWNSSSGASQILNKPTIPSAAATGTHIATSTDASTGVITVNVDDITNAGTDVDSTDTGLTTGKAVYEYVQSQTNGNTIPAQDPLVCDSTHPCALVNEDGTLSWKRMAI